MSLGWKFSQLQLPLIMQALLGSSWEKVKQELYKNVLLLKEENCKCSFYYTSVKSAKPLMCPSFSGITDRGQSNCEMSFHHR